jgi:hypothetical protein
MEVTWSDLGKPTKPGRYAFQDCEVVVDPNAIVIWRKHPNAVFTLRFTDLWGGARRASLGEYEVPGGKPDSPAPHDGANTEPKT